VTLEVQGIKFVQNTLDFRAAGTVSLTFVNKDAGTQHNFHLFGGPDANAPSLFTGDLTTGPARTTYTFTAPDRPGSYFFHCDVHPTQMTGKATVTAGPPGPPGPGGVPGALPLSAKNLAFSVRQLTAPSAGDVTIHFTNDDPNIPHDVVVFNGKDATAPVLFHGDTVTGPGSQDYTFKAPPPGTYFFHCEFHPTQMTGTITFR
jgi:plastocyanin